MSENFNPWWGNQEIAREANVSVRTVHQWRYRNLLPLPGRLVSGGRPQWRRRVILAWLESTGRKPLTMESDAIGA